MHELNPTNWVRLYADYLLRYALFRINDTALCEDLVQETFFSALRAKEQFKGNSSEKTWLTSILRNKIIDEYRKKGKMHDSLDDESFYGQFFEADTEYAGHWKQPQFPQLWDDSVVEKMESREYYAILHQCIGKLPEKSVAILQEKYFEESDSQKICKDFNLSKSNYWTTMHRINLQLRKCIELNWVLK
ncbi:MAG: sigma-70 family RNA polymerase sigma factor [Chitinophagaceae bacterium]|nr:sigma-70 family RNA polymerase sigma factor [Chitinophagaceae bacterium]